MIDARVLIAFVMLTAPVAETVAIPVKTYDLRIEFSHCEDNFDTEFASTCTSESPVTTGVGYHGRFTVARSDLLSDGYNNAGFQSFYLELGPYRWDSVHPFPESDYAGSRFFNPDSGAGGFGPWTLLVQDGDVTGICCGVYGTSDEPFVDLYSWDFGGGLPPNYVGVVTGGFERPSFSAAGMFSIRPLPEPNPLYQAGFSALLLLAIRVSRRMPRLRSHRLRTN